MPGQRVLRLLAEAWRPRCTVPLELKNVDWTIFSASGHAGSPDAASASGETKSDMNKVDIREIGSMEEVKALLEEVDVVFAVQRGDEDNRSMVFGLQWIRTIAAGVVGSQSARPLEVIIDFDTDELEQLCAAVQTVKGFHEYGEH
jgi:hypothetical protein